MKWGRFWLGVASGMAIGYWLYKETQEKNLKPEHILHQLKETYRKEFPIIGSWIHVQPVEEEIGGLRHRIYQCGLTGLIKDEPRYFQFKIDADSGDILTVDTN